MQQGPPDGARRDPADEVLVRAMLARELDALMTTRAADPGLRLRVLMRMADRIRIAA